MARVSYLAGIERRFSDGLPRIFAYCGSGALCFWNGAHASCA
nr:MAG TPA: hypothetical protein [Caudoviricetes sp.]